MYTSLRFIFCLFTLISANLANAATYNVRYIADWNSSQLTSPSAYPSNAHFTNLVGATHLAGEALWAPGGLASESIEFVAELGASGSLRVEVHEAIAQGRAGEYISFPSVYNFPSVNETTINLTNTFSEISLISMIAPSPDWFVGVSGVSLLDQDGNWIPQLEIDLFPWDAGTEKGISFNLNNSATFPQQTIQPLLNSPFDGRPALGQLQFELQEVPLPGSVWLMLSAILGLVLKKSKFDKKCYFS